MRRDLLAEIAQSSQRDLLAEIGKPRDLLAEMQPAPIAATARANSAAAAADAEQRRNADPRDVYKSDPEGRAFDSLIEQFVAQNPDASSQDVLAYSTDLSKKQFGGAYALDPASIEKSLSARADLRQRGVRQSPIQVIGGKPLSEEGVSGPVNVDQLEAENLPTFAQSIGKGAVTTRQLFSQAAGAVGEAAGSDDLARWGNERAQIYAEIAAAMPKGVELSRIDSLTDAIQWAKQTVGEQGSLMATPIAGSLVGGTIKGSVGATIGAFAPSYGLALGEIAGQNKQADPDATAGLATFTGAAAVAALDSITPGKFGTALVRRFGQDEAEQIAERALLLPMNERLMAAVRSVGGTAGTTAAREGWTEGTQQVVGELASSVETGKPITPGLLGRSLEAAVTGGFMGGVIGAGQGVMTNARRPSVPGIIEEANATPSLTPDDMASPLPTDALNVGKTAIMGAEAHRKADGILEGLGLPRVGARVDVTGPDGTVRKGTVADAFESEVEGIGQARGIKIKLDDGTTLDEFGDTLKHMGVRISETSPGPLYGAMPDPAKGDVVDLNVNTPALEPSESTPVVTASEPRAAPDQGDAIRFVMNNLEGGGQRVIDSGGVTRFGVSQRANPDVDVENLTEAQAIEIYRKRYMEPLGLEDASPDFALVAFDAAINHGLGAAKEMIAKADGDAGKLLQLRRQEYQRLVAEDPAKYGQYQSGWENRLQKLEGELGGAPSGTAVAAADPSTETEDSGATAALLAEINKEPAAASAETLAMTMPEPEADADAGIPVGNTGWRYQMRDDGDAYVWEPERESVSRRVVGPIDQAKLERVVGEIKAEQAKPAPVAAPASVTDDFNRNPARALAALSDEQFASVAKDLGIRVKEGAPRPLDRTGDFPISQVRAAYEAALNVPDVPVPVDTRIESAASSPAVDAVPSSPSLGENDGAQAVTPPAVTPTEPAAISSPAAGPSQGAGGPGGSPAPVFRQPRARAAKGPEDVLSFIKRHGGIRNDESHDLYKGRGLGTRPGLIRRNGRTVDEVGELLHEAGYFVDRPTTAQVLELLDRADTRKVYKPEEQAAADEAARDRDLSAQEADVRAEILATAEELGLVFRADDVDAALNYVAAGETVDAAIERAMYEAALDALDHLEADTENSYYEPTAAYEGDQAESRGEADDTRSQDGPDREAPQGVSGPERVARSEGGGRGADAQPDRAVEARQGQDAEAQLDAFGQRAGDERRALERAGEGRSRSDQKQKPPGSDGGLFDDNGARQSDIEDAPRERRADSADQAVPVEAWSDVASDLYGRLKQLKIGDKARLELVGLLFNPQTGQPDRRVAGRYFNDVITVALGSVQDPNFTISHEAWHFFDENMIRPAERAAMNKAVLADDRLMASIRQRYPDLTPAQQMEEARADLFAMRSEFTPKGFIRDAFDRIIYFLKSLGEALRLHFLTAEDVIAAIERGDVGARPGRLSGEERQRLMVAWHGTPHDFDTFSTDAIGTGEGNQTFGWGLYFAGRKEVAEHYRLLNDDLKINGRELTHEEWGAYNEFSHSGKNIDRALANNASLLARDPSRLSAYYERQRILEKWKENPPSFEVGGRLYQVELPSDDEFLLWDRPLSEQSKAMQDAYREAAAAIRPDWNPDIDSGRSTMSLYTDLILANPNKGLSTDERAKAASLALRDAGIAGIKYLDGGSRSAGDGTHNYVVFDDARVQVLGKYSLADDVTPDPKNPLNTGPGKRKTSHHPFPDADMEAAWLEEDGFGPPVPEGMKPADYELFARKVMLDDLTWNILVPFNLANRFPEEKLTAARISLDAAVEKSPAVQDAVRRYKLSRALAEQARNTVPQDVTEAEETENIRAANIRVDKLETTDQIRAALKDIAGTQGDFKGARRGVQTQEQTRALAAELGMTTKELLSRRKGEAFNAENLLAARQLLVASADNLLELAKKADGGSDADMVAFRSAWIRHVAIQEQVSGLTAEAGRALNQFKMMAKSGADLNARMMREIIDTEGGRDDLEAIARTIVGISGDPVRLNRYARDVFKPTLKDKLFELWINGLLSGPATHVVNTVSNTLTLLTQLPEFAIASGIGAVRSLGRADSDRILASEVGARAAGMIQGAKEGAIAAAAALRTGEGSDAMSKIEARRMRAISGLKGEIIRIPGRLLVTGDEFYKAVARRMELSAQAVRIAAKEGLTGDALQLRAAELAANPTEEMMQQAIDYGRYATFQRQLGPIGQSLTSFINRVPGMRVIVPFIRAPANIFKYAIERTPAAPVLGEVRADLKAGGARRDLALARIMFGSGIGAMVMMLTAQWLISGGDPEDDDARRLLRAQGWQPYSVKIGSTWYSYARLDPLATILGLAADLNGSHPNMSQAEIDEAGFNIFLSILNQLKNKTFLSGIGTLIEAIQDPGRYGEGFLAKLAGSVIPTGVAQLNNTLDPTVRDNRSIGQRVQSRVPGLSDNIAPKRDVWGRVIERKGGVGPDVASPFWASEQVADPVTDELLKAGVALNVPSRKVKGVELTAEQYDAYQELAGDYLRRGAENLVARPGWETATDEQKRDAFDGLKSRARRAARRRLGLSSD